MRNMRFKVSELNDKIKANRDQHRAIFLEALEGYKKKVLEELEKHITAIREGKVQAVYVNLPQPEDHTKDYDRVLTMLSMCTENAVELNEVEFGQYVMDDWNWKRKFLASNSVYSASAARLQADYNDDNNY